MLRFDRSPETNVSIEGISERIGPWSERLPVTRLPEEVIRDITTSGAMDGMAEIMKRAEGRSQEEKTRALGSTALPERDQLAA